MSIQLYTLKSLPTAIPRAAETEVELWPAPKGSYSLSLLFVKPAEHSYLKEISASR